jgi:hypothetical protein
METSKKPDVNPHLWLELAVPLLSFGGAFIAIFSQMQGISLDFHYSALGCVIASCILAYLAWLRPKKDIVALSTPIYSFIFFIVPTDIAAGVFLQLLYAVSLTILLVRLKSRFGKTAPLPGTPIQEGPLDEYLERVNQAVPDIPPALSADAGAVFIRFAQGDYDGAARFAGSRSGEQYGEGAGSGLLLRAFAIVAEQAAQSIEGIPATFQSFSLEENPFLFYPPDATRDLEQEYAAALDNALILLYAAALSSHDTDRKTDLAKLRPFARRLCGEM